MTHTVYLALGSNLGDRLEQLHRAQEAMQPAVCIVETSPVYETPPWGFQDQPAFLNQIVKGETELPPTELLVLLKGIEVSMGREPTVRNGPRPIDLDILFYDDLVLDGPKLSIPHPRMEGRGFVLVPLADLAPDLRHPVSGKTVREMLDEADQEGIRLFG